jgi:hypothetical protein
MWKVWDRDDGHGHDSDDNSHGHGHGHGRMGKIYMDVDTGHCGFAAPPSSHGSASEPPSSGGIAAGFAATTATATVPQYVISVANMDSTYDVHYRFHDISTGAGAGAGADAGAGLHYHGPGVTGATSVVTPTVNSFRVILTTARDAVMSSSVSSSSSSSPLSDLLLETAIQQGWFVTWAADTGTNAGLTVGHRTEWKQYYHSDGDGDGDGDGQDHYGENVLYTDIDTTRNTYNGHGYGHGHGHGSNVDDDDDIIYFASIYGVANHWYLQVPGSLVVLVGGLVGSLNECVSA